MRSLIVPGGSSRASIPELNTISEASGMDIEVHEICCTLEPNEFNRPFTDIFGSPILEVKTNEEKIIDVKVLKGAPCGSTWYMAKEIVGLATRMMK